MVPDRRGHGPLDRVPPDGRRLRLLWPAPGPLRVPAPQGHPRHLRRLQKGPHRPPRLPGEGRPVSVTRRELLAMPALLAAAPATDARLDDLRIEFQDFQYRAPYKFGGKEVDRVTLLNVHSRLSTKAGKSAAGFASMPLGNIWSFPDLPYDTSLDAMKRLAGRIEKITKSYTEYGHPLDVDHALEPEYLKATAEVWGEMQLRKQIPKLCTLVTASPVDAAIHDAYGRLHGRNSFSIAGKDFVRYDLSHYLDSEFRGEYL